MAWQQVTVVRREGEKPRFLYFDDAPNKDGSEGRGASMIAALKRQARREELHSVTVTPAVAEIPPRKAAAKKATKAAEAPASE